MFFYDKEQFPNSAVNYHNSSMASYEKYFSNVNPAAKVVLEASPGYLCSRTALHEVPRLASKPKVFFILRKPSARLFSSYTFMMNGSGLIPAGTSFEAFLQSARSGNFFYNPLEHCRYSKYLSRWIESLGGSRVSVFIFEELRASPLTVMKDISSFVGIDWRFWDDYEFTAKNQTPEIRNLAWYKIMGVLDRAFSFFPTKIKRKVHRAYLKVDSVLPRVADEKAVSQRIVDESREALRALDLEFRGEVEELSKLINRDLRIWD